MSVSPRKYQRMFFYLARGHVEGMKYLSDTGSNEGPGVLLERVR
jgi:hypothetical protein